jgi:CheY-like chemotaxis protein
MEIKEKPADVLLVEDNPGEARLVLWAFKKCNPGKNILWVNDGEKALKYLMSGELQETFSEPKKPLLVLLDLSLPKIGGIDLLKKIKESKTTRDMEVIVITGSQRESDMVQSYEYGVKTYMKKEIVCENCIRMICGEKADESVAKAFNEAYK